MFRNLRALGLGLLAALMALQPALASIYVGGDSLGVGVGMASKAPSVAKESVRITSKLPVNQIGEVPKGSTLFLSLGTNDAVGGVLKVQKSVDAILSAAADRGIRVVWLGPPCVFKTWDDHAKALDDVLASIMAQQGVTYVSMRDDALCVRSLRAGDGVHFTMKGYRMMWDRAVAASGEADTAPVLPAATSKKSRRLAALAAAPTPMPMPGFRTGRMSPGQVFPVSLPAFHRPYQ
ncbi:MAG: GDSL-type esterase/lipase family protein [Devosia sp.]